MKQETMKQTLLVVDDDPSVRESVRKLLEAENFEVIAAGNAETAVQRFRTKAIDLVVLDLNLGADDGWAVYKEMMGINPSIPTIIVTGEKGQLNRAVAVGAGALLEKPIDVPSFLETIRALLANTAEQEVGRSGRAKGACRYVAQDRTGAFELLQERHSSSLKSQPGSKPRCRVSPEFQ
jgi:DNA-binding response OmpR family regulator